MDRRRSQRPWRIAGGDCRLDGGDGYAPHRARRRGADDSSPRQPGSTWNDSGQFFVVGGLLDSGTMPDKPAAGIEAAAAQSWTATGLRLHLIAGATFFPQQDMGNQMLSGVPSGRYWMVSFSGRGCLTAVFTRFEIGPCLGGEVAVMHASKIDGLPSTDSTQSWASPLGSAVAAFTLASRVVLFARADVVVPDHAAKLPVANECGVLRRLQGSHVRHPGRRGRRVADLLTKLPRMRADGARSVYAIGPP